LTVFVALVAAVIAALWLAARRTGTLRIALPVLTVLALIPCPARAGFATGYHVPPFFTDAAYRDCVAPGAIVLPLPIRELGDALLWQAESGFRFELAGGEIGPEIPPSFETPGPMAYVVDGKPVPPARAGILRAFIARKDVSTVIVDQAEAGQWAGALDRIARPHAVAGVVLYQVRGAAPACPSG
jgi:hypothetical protein